MANDLATRMRILSDIHHRVFGMRLSRDITSKIVGYVVGFPWLPLPQDQGSAHLSVTPAFTPPANGRCVFMELPAELRKAIFTEELPARHATVHPTCDDADATQDVKETALGKRMPPRCNRTSDLMTINKRICSEVAQVVYEERTFAIHVHEGIRNGGIEFLNTGRQPLQYQEQTSDTRFWKFGVGGDFGFTRLKKFEIIIYPAASRDQTRHTAINTYLMHLALCRLLERSGQAEKDRITRIEIYFAERDTLHVQERSGRGAVQNAEGYWWDSDKQEPRTTSIHGLSNVELVLRPFSTLHGCRCAYIHLPSKVRNHGKTITFVATLEQTMTSKILSGLCIGDDLEVKIESARTAMDEHIMHTLYGSKDHFGIEKLTEAEMKEDEIDDPFIEDGRSGHSRKHDVSPASSEIGGVWKWHRSWVDGDEEMLQTALASSQSEMTPEQRMKSFPDEDADLQQALLLSAQTSSRHAQHSSGLMEFSGEDEAIYGSVLGRDGLNQSSSPVASGPNYSWTTEKMWEDLPFQEPRNGDAQSRRCTDDTCATDLLKRLHLERVVRGSQPDGSALEAAKAPSYMNPLNSSQRNSSYASSTFPDLQVELRENGRRNSVCDKQKKTGDDHGMEQRSSV